MGGYESFYGSSNYGLKSNYGNPISNYTPAGSINLALDPRTANQLKEVSKNLNAGAKSMEVQLTFPQVAESIPDSHLEEINRLRKLTNIDLTLHGPLVDPTGFTGEGNFDPIKQKQAERQMWNAVQRATKINPDGNVIVTLHSSNGMHEPETRYWDEKKNKHVVSNIAVVDERTGQIGQLPPTNADYLLEQEKVAEKEGKSVAELSLEKRNREIWLDQLSGLNLELQRAKEVLDRRIMTPEGKIVKMGGDEGQKNALEMFKLHKEGKGEEIEKVALELAKKFPEEIKQKEILENTKEQIENLERADIYIRHSFNQFKELYNRAYGAIEKDKNELDKEKMENIKNKITKAVDTKTGYLKDPSELIKFADTLTESIQTMNSITEPKMFKQLKEFAIEKSAETFSNIALNAYKEFKDKAPILSIENPPVGMGLSRAEELSTLIEESREQFKIKLIKEGLSESEAKKQSEKLIGATWDVGHINMLRKYGYGNKQLQEQAKIIAPFVNKIHLSDNFGYEHTELPMGMGNVPMAEHLEELKKAHGEKMKEIKQVIETGNWYQHFQTNPFVETLAAFGSPIYGAGSQQWNQVANGFAGYFSGYGLNPDVHHSLYGAGFANLPAELGGQMQGRSRLSGAPIE